MKQGHKRAARRRKRGLNREKRRDYHAKVARYWVDFNSRWRNAMKLPDHRHESNCRDFIARILDPTLESSEHDQWLAEHIGSTNYEIACAVIGFNDPNHAFAYRMRWC